MSSRLTYTIYHRFDKSGKKLYRVGITFRPTPSLDHRDLINLIDELAHIEADMRELEAKEKQP